MQLDEVKNMLECTVFVGEGHLVQPIEFGCASDLMSDVLAFSKAHAVLLTGLANIQTIRTAAVAQIAAVVLVRGKKPDSSMIQAAKEQNMALLGTPYSMYEACGILYQKGLVSTMKPVSANSTRTDR
jgi:predicted transcriptional regulator